jgi:hypothetical protein
MNQKEVESKKAIEFLRNWNNHTSKTEALKAQIEYMREIGCDKLANLLVDDLEAEIA